RDPARLGRLAGSALRCGIPERSLHQRGQRADEPDRRLHRGQCAYLLAQRERGPGDRAGSHQPVRQVLLPDLVRPDGRGRRLRHRSAGAAARMGGDGEEAHLIGQPIAETGRAATGRPSFLRDACRGQSAIAGTEPQTSSATSTTRRILSACCSVVMSLPWTVLAKPHCGLKASWSMSTNFVASSMRRLMSSLLSRSPSFVVTRPSTTVLPFGRKRKGAKSPERGSSYSRKNASISSSLNMISATGS